MSTIVTRAGKGSPLTHVEVDANFTNLNTDKVEKTSADITGGTINGTTIGATTPSTVNATTLSGQTGVLRGTGQNLLLQSQDFTTSWTNTATTDTANTQTAPDGTLTADTLTAQATTNFHDITQSIAVNSANRTLSVFLKKGTHDYFQLCFLGDATPFANFDLGLGVVGTKAASVTSSITSVGNDWYRCTIEYASSAATFVSLCIVSSASAVRRESWTATGTETVFLWGAQLELGSTANTYIPTTTTAVYGTPTLSFSGVSEIGLQSNGALYLQPAGTGAIQAQATTSTTAGGNARGSWSVDWQLTRASAAQVASGLVAVVAGGGQNTASNTYATVSGGQANTASNLHSAISGGLSNTASGQYSVISGGASHTAAGLYNFVGGGFTNSGTANAAVTTQSGTMNATTAVTLSGSNANIKIGQYITGTSISGDTYVSAISGTSLTLSKNASGSSTSTLSFFTPHGVVVGGGNNQATGSYSFIGGGGDAGTAANRNVASGAWSTIGGGNRNTASGLGSFVGGNGGDGAAFYPNTASGVSSAIVCGTNNTASGSFSFIGAGISHGSTGTYAFIGSGVGNTANGFSSAIVGGTNGNTRSITGNHVFPACNNPIANASGVSQAALLILATQTTDATATVLRSESGAAGTTNQVILPNNSAYYFKGSVIAGKTAAGDTSAWVFEGAIKRGANAGTTTLVAAVTPTLVSQDAGASGWVLAIAADTTNGGLKVTVTGQASTTIRWVCRIQTTEMTF